MSNELESMYFKKKRLWVLENPLSKEESACVMTALARHEQFVFTDMRYYKFVEWFNDKSASIQLKVSIHENIHLIVVASADESLLDEIEDDQCS